MIGIIGSGLDGMIVTKAVREKNPGVDVVCFCDNRRFFPEAACHPDEMRQNTVGDAAFLADSGAKLILIASHTLSCIAGAALADAGDVPVLDIVTPTVNRAVLKSRHRSMGIIGSRAVIESRLYPEKIQKQCPDGRVYSASAPLLLPLIEDGWLKKPVTAMIIKRYLIPLKIRQIDTLVLASTAYALLSTVIQRKIGIRIQVIDGADVLAETVAEYLSRQPDAAESIRRNGRLEVMLTWPSESLEKQARGILHIRDIKIATA